jgi:hypothetical protein
VTLLAGQLYAGVFNDVGARQRPNLGANQRGRASTSSSADNGGASNRLGTCVWRLRRCLTPMTDRATNTAGIVTNAACGQDAGAPRDVVCLGPRHPVQTAG